MSNEDVFIIGKTRKDNQVLKYDFCAAQKSIRKKISNCNQKVFKRKSQSKKMYKNFESSTRRISLCCTR